VRSIVVLGRGHEEVAAGWTVGLSLQIQEAVEVGDGERADDDLRRGQPDASLANEPKMSHPLRILGP
jgi:hypothetical protein